MGARDIREAARPGDSGNLLRAPNDIQLGTTRDGSTDTRLNALTLKRYHRLEILERVARAANGLQDVDTILNISLDSILEIIEVTAGGILLMDKEPGVLYYRTHRGLSVRHIAGIRIPVGEGTIGRVTKTGEPVLIEDVSGEPCVFQRELGGVERFRGLICVPLKRRDEIVGAIVVMSQKRGRFGNEDLDLLSYISDYVAHAVIRTTVVDRKISKGMARYQALLQYALTAQEDERKRIARELHDETSQTLTSLTFRLQAAIQMAEAKGFGDARFKESLHKAHAYAVQAGNEIVKLMMNLRPTLLDDLGMPAAIYRYAKDTLEPGGININAEFIGGKHRLPAEVEVACFRVAQGLISNILRHSQAKNALIKVECNPGKAVLYIEDDGIGFDVGKMIEVEPNGRGAGLFTMRERLRLVGGTGNIESSPGKGTRIIVTVPVIRSLEDLANEQDNSNDS